MPQGQVDLIVDKIGIDVHCADNSEWLLLPLVLNGRHAGLRVEVEAIDGIRFDNVVLAGDALPVTVTRSRASTFGASLYATTAVTSTRGTTASVVSATYLPDFRGIQVSIEEVVAAEPTGVPLYVRVREWSPCATAGYILRVTVWRDNAVVGAHQVPWFSHPSRGKVLWVAGGDDPRWCLGSSSAVLGRALEWDLQGAIPLERIQARLTDSHVGVHVVTNVNGATMHVGGRTLAAHDFFRALGGRGLSFVYLATCNSVSVVSAFRDSDIHALVASTTNLEVSYADRFEAEFYARLDKGLLLSEAFKQASLALKAGTDTPQVVSRLGYNPMFLETRGDVRFGRPD